MKTNPRILATVILTALGASAAWAQSTQPWQVTLDVGATVVDNPKLNQADGEVDVDPGMFVTVGATYRAVDWLRVGPELGFAVNYIDRFGNYRPNSDADLFQMPFLLNAIFEPPQDWVVKPFAGVGAGGLVSVLSSKYYWYQGYWYDVGESDSDTTLGFAWQAMAGVKWQINENLAVGVTYRFLEAEGQDWTFRDFRRGPDELYTFSVDRLRTHFVSVAGHWNF